MIMRKGLIVDILYVHTPIFLKRLEVNKVNLTVTALEMIFFSSLDFVSSQFFLATIITLTVH